ncbi:SPG17 protein, partial [Acromyrmex charruanus]
MKEIECIPAHECLGEVENAEEMGSFRNGSREEGTGLHEENDWCSALDSILINDDHWWCIVTMMVETFVEHSRYISLFSETVEEEEQACIYSLSYQKTIDTVKTLSKQDPEKCPAVESICHYANTILSENNGHLSTWLIARLIKYLIYRTKTKYIERLKVEADIDCKIDEEYRTIQNTDSSISSRSTIEDPILQRAYSNKTEYVFNGKANVRSRVSNVPFDGPNLYVVLSGFHNPDLPAELLSVGVPLTCILEIKLSGEKYIGHRETKENDIRDKTPSFEDHQINEIKLVEFWRVTHERFANLSAHPMYANITILTIDLPVFPETVNFIKKESLRRDIYNRILFTLYHLYELYRQHAKYLKNMKLEKRIFDKRDEVVDTKIYDDVLKNIPNEYIDAPLILSAILLQVEHNLTTSSDGCFLADHDTGFSDADTRHENTSTTAERSPTFNMQAKLKLLDLEYELIDEYDTSQSLQSSDLEVIPYGDTLSVIIRHFHDRRATLLDDAVLRVLRNPRIINVWRNHEVPTRSKSDMYFCHLDNIARAFNREQKVSREEVVHYLHLLMFDDLIFSGSSREARSRLVQPPRDELSELKHMRSKIKRARSVPNFTSPPTTASGLCRCKSDTEIDYCKPVVAFAECPLLFTLTDTRETLLPGYLCKNVFKKRSYQRPSLEEYEDVELLSSRVFLQVVHECFQSFDRFVARYFRPTDSLLLYFSNNDAVNNVSEERCLSSICTPIGLYEFCEYIAKKEENWIKREQETRQSHRMDLTGRFMKNSIEVEDDAIIFDDKCFILRDSLKARRLKKGLDRYGQKKIFETEEFEKAAVENTGGSYDFVGYDLGSRRVQVIHHSKKFFLDGDTSVRIELEDWLYGDRNLRIAVTLLNSTLRLSGRVSQSTGTFHLTTKRGIVLGFYRNRRELAENSSDSHWQNFTFDFRASWPSGLLIEPTIGDGTKNPFYIRQSYVSKRPGCAGAAREVYRNFLRNGTVLKYLDDNTVIIFRSNGVIVTCMDFDKPQSRDESIQETDSKTEFRIKKGNSRQSASKHSGKVIDSTEKRSNGSMLDAQPSKHMPLNDIINKGDDSLITGAFAVGEVLRYSVVNYDGRCYEVLNDLVVSEHDRLLVRTTLDYEVNEVFTRRADGTDTLLRSNGELVVTFPDGTCIITGYMIEEQPVICEWTENELQYFGITKTFEMKEYGDQVASTLSPDVEFSHESLSMPHTKCQEKQTKVSIVDGFVSILLTFRMEHKDYATVFYDQSAVSCTLSMPDNLHISISRRGHYEVSMEDQVNLKIFDNDAVFWKICATCGGKSMSTYVSDKRTDYDRIELPRSTYSFPYNWLFPFGKKVISERTRNEVLAKRNEQSLPKLLRVRVFFGIKGADRSVLIDMQRAMGRYWISDFSFHQVLRDGDKCRLFYATESSRPCEVENDYGSLEDSLRKLAVGVKRSIDVETYVRSLQGKLIKSTKARQSSRLAELLRQRGSMKKVYEWTLMRIRFGGAAIASHLLPVHVISVPASPAFLGATIVRADHSETLELPHEKKEESREEKRDRLKEFRLRREVQEI